MARTPVCGAGYDSSILSFGTNSLLIRLTVGHLSLTQGIVVRIHDEQPIMGHEQNGNARDCKSLRCRFKSGMPLQTMHLYPAPLRTVTKVTGDGQK